MTVEDLRPDDSLLKPHFEVKTCDWFHQNDDGLQPKPVTGFHL